MEFDPSLDGLLGAVELSRDLGDGNVMLEHLFDGGALGSKRVTRLLFLHRGLEWKRNRDGRFNNSTIGKNIPALNTPLVEQIRKFDVFHGNPSLVRIVAGVPITLFCKPNYDWNLFSTSPRP